jgi:hypothetical protein
LVINIGQMLHRREFRSNPFVGAYNLAQGRNREAMKATLLLWAGFACCAALAQSSAARPGTASSKCPVGFDHIELPYNHAGGQSVPELRLTFSNRTDKTIAGFVFSLSILDSDGNPVPYTSQFNYRREFPAGEPQRARVWRLDPASVDIHRSGESVTLLETTFADGTTWKDDGSQACTLSFDYHAK